MAVKVTHVGNGGAADQSVSVKDSRGRKIGLRKLPFLEEFRILETVGPELSANAVYMGMLNFLLLIGDIDGVAAETPRSKLQVEALIQWAGKEAFAAIANAIEHDKEVRRFFGADPKHIEQQIKNSDGTPASETVAG